MPPNPYLYEGRDAIGPLLERAFGPESPGEWRLLPTSAPARPGGGASARLTPVSR